MTVTSTNQKVSFNGDGSTTVFAYNYKIFAQTDLLVILRVTATGTETKQFISTNYSVRELARQVAAMSRWVQPQPLAQR